ncbi:leucyl aminopeptidase family protein [Sulfobacillus thermosulfidooxidans]|uniref:leucyl aminopeptidase family protein n=1 Tax=Sulfobacillus thermosulfidooxidans TaxID=28034 RepID=UPI0006B5CBCA|nr:leucyl aminopeptidase family protein [Sulfobacillus thermosulfidooxidans]
MRTWIVTDHIPSKTPSVFIVPRELWESARTMLDPETGKFSSLPQGSPVVIAQKQGCLIIVDTPPVRQQRYRAYSEAARLAEQQGSSTVGVFINKMDESVLPSVIFGLEQGFYHYHGKGDKVDTVIVVTEPNLEERIRYLTNIAEAQSWVREWVNAPANEKPPQRLAEEYQKDAPPGISYHLYTHDDLAALGAGGILAVGSGSTRPPVILAGRYHGNGDGPWLALVGKGIVFDSGGISLKGRDGMGRMKGDMAGSAAVMAALRVVAEHKWPVNVAAWAPLAENLPDGAAYRPGDVLEMLDHTRVEIISTDAEGRLVLADAVTMAIREGASTVVDMATLTGSNVVALGGVRATLIGNDGSVSRLLTESGQDMEEPVWEMPHDPEYALMNTSSIADLKNSGGRAGGTISAGLFIGHFATQVPWAHVDIAGLAFKDNESGTGATGYGVALLVEFCRRWAEFSKESPIESHED